MVKATLERLAELHVMAKEHPFRLSRMGTGKHYYEILDKLGEEFIALVKKAYTKDKSPFKKWIWAHQYWSCILAIRGNYKRIEEYMVVLESYLQTIHAFYESGGKLDFFYMHSGYSTYSKKQHKDSPMRSLKYIYYPQFDEYDVTKFYAKAEMVHYKRWLKENTRGLKKAKKDYELKTKEEKKKRSSMWDIEYHELRIKWWTKRLKNLMKFFL